MAQTVNVGERAVDPARGVIERNVAAPVGARFRSRYRATHARRRSVAALVRSPHVLPLSALVFLSVVLMRNWLVSSELPAGMDSGFLYSFLTYFGDHDIGAFLVWLPAPFGEIQQYSVYWFLAMVQHLVGDALLVYRTAALATALVTAVGMYGLAYWLTRSRLSAALAAGLYALSPLAVSHWVGGHLNIEISYAVGPLAVWGLWSSLRSGRVHAMVGLGLAASALFLLTTGQGVYWLLPLGVIGVAELTWLRGGAPLLTRARHGLLTVAIAGLVFAMASAVQLVPLAAGLKSPFVQGDQRYYVEELAVHAKYSLPIIQGVAGVPAENWLVPGTSVAVVPFDSMVFRFAAGAFLFFALAALVGPRARVAVALLIPAVAAWLLAAGPEGPASRAYLFLYDHVPYFRWLRAPNRWVMVSVFGTSLLVALTTAALRREGPLVPPRPRASRRRGRHRLSRRSALRRLVDRLTPAGAGAAFVGLLGLSFAQYGLVGGLPTWHAPSGYERAYAPLRADPGDWRMMTTPFYQAWMPAGHDYGSDVVYAADLGHVSTMWHGRPTIARGGWDPRASRFVQYLYEVTKQGVNESLTKLLGAAGVRYLGLNDHPAVEVVRGQNAFFHRQDGLRLASEAIGVEVYENLHALPQAFVAEDRCVVAGGLAVLGDLAAHSDFDFGRVGIQFADQLVATGGRPALEEGLRGSSCLILGPGGDLQMDVLAGASDVVDLSLLAPREWQRSYVPPHVDIGAEVATFLHLAPGDATHGEIQASRAGPHELWVSAIRGPDEGVLELEIDGREAGRIDLAAPVEMGVRWGRGASVHLGAGSHRFSVNVSSLGSSVEAQVVGAALVPTNDVGAWRRTPGLRVIEEVSDEERMLLEPDGVIDLARPLVREWEPAQGVHARVSPTGGLELTTFEEDRPYFTVARTTTNEEGLPFPRFAVRFTGEGSLEPFYVNFLFDDEGRDRVSFRILDITTEPRILFFDPGRAPLGTVVPDWSGVRQVTISTNSKDAWVGRIVVEGPYALRGVSEPRFVDADGAVARFGPGGSWQLALAPEDQPIDERVTLAEDLPAGLLVFTQSYHPLWRLRGGAATGHSIALGFANAYPVSSALHSGSLEFEGARHGRIGTGLSLAGWTMGLALLASLWVRHRRERAGVNGDADR